MDYAPWPSGLRFESAELWWHYVRSLSEGERLDSLLLLAVLSDEIGDLLLRHDATLLERFAFPEQTETLLCEIEAKTLDEFARQVLARRL